MPKPPKFIGGCGKLPKPGIGIQPGGHRGANGTRPIGN
jgi:hypothetical protein